MSITLITGLPGMGKTASAVELMTELVGKRPIFSMGIRDLKVPHEMVPPIAEWTELRPLPEDPSLTMPFFTFPPNSVIFIDECQAIYRPRANGSKVPDFVAANETHRHTGVDFVLLTQDPFLIDSNVRRFVNRHIHIRQTFLGRFKHEWTELADIKSPAARLISRKDRFKPSKKVFALYKSSELHTKIPIRMPWYVYIFGFCVVAVAAGGWYVTKRIQEHNKPSDLATVLGQGTKATGGAHSGSGGQSLPVKTKAEYVEALVPRVDGQPFTAPVYDSATVVSVAPVPAVCYSVMTAKGGYCRCKTQQGTNYETTVPECLKVVQGGFFKPWLDVSRGTDRGPTGSQPISFLPGGEPFPPVKVDRPVDAESLHLAHS